MRRVMSEKYNSVLNTRLPTFVLFIRNSKFALEKNTERGTTREYKGSNVVHVCTIERPGEHKVRGAVARDAASGLEAAETRAHHERRVAESVLVSRGSGSGVVCV